MASLSRENCQKILLKYYSNDYNTNFSYSLTPFQRHNILKIKFNENNISHNGTQFFVKTFDCDSVTSTLTSKKKDLNKEISFYYYISQMNGIALTAENIIPKIYFADKKANTLVLEDLSMNGYTKGINVQFNEDHVQVALTSLAKFHSLSIVHDLKLKDALENDKRKYATEESLFGNITDDVLQLLIKNLSQQIKSSEDNYQAKLLVEYKKMLQDFIVDSPGTNVCCHGDLFFDNILFQYDSNELPINCKFIDFAFARYKPPAHDLTMLLYNCVSSKLRQEKYEHYLKYYYIQMKEILKQNNLNIASVLPLNEYELSCKMYMRHARMIEALYKVIHNSSEETQECDKNYIRNYTIQSDLSTTIDNTILSIEDIHTVVQNRLKTVNYELQEYELRPVAVKIGFLGEHTNLTVTILDQRRVTQTLKYFVKSLPQMESQRNFVIETGGIFKETNWFQKLVPHYNENRIDIIQPCIPACYLARDNDVFVFEDLKEDGFGMLSARTSIGLHGIRHAISSLAKFHAAPLILEELKSMKLGRKYRLTEDYAKEFEETFYSKSKQAQDLITAIRLSIPAYINLLTMPTNSTMTKEDIINMQRRFIGEFYDDVQPSTKFRNTICHGDLWTNNIMFKMENNIITNARFVDFQSYRYGPPAQDLMAMIYFTTDRALRKTYMSSLVTYYYDELTRNIENYNLDIKDIISFDEFKMSVEHYEKFAVSQASVHLQMAPMSDHAMKRFIEDKDWSRKCLFVDRTENLTKCCEDDPVYRKIQEETSMDLWELCEKLKLKT